MVAKSAYWPAIFGNVTGAAAPDGTRITAGALNNPSIFDRFAGGVIATQLVTDFGRTSDLVATQNIFGGATIVHSKVAKGTPFITVRPNSTPPVEAASTPEVVTVTRFVHDRAFYCDRLSVFFGFHPRFGQAFREPTADLH